MKRCVHCRRKPVSRPLGLCWGCYYTPEIRRQHPSTSKFCKRGVGLEPPAHPAPLPAPVPFVQGSPEKVAALEARAAAGQALFHPDDGVSVSPVFHG